MRLQQTHLTKKLSAVLIIAGFVLLIGHKFELYLPELEAWVKSLGVFAPLGFILVFTILSPFFVSVDVLSFAAGVLFPIVTAELVVLIATYLSAAVIFFLGRDLLRARVKAFIAGHKRFTELDKLISEDNAFKFMLLLRLTPLPFALLSYALSVTDVKFRPYLGATSGILIYNGSLVYFGYVTKHLNGLAKGASQAGFISYFMPVLGLAAFIAVLVYVAKSAGNLLKEMKFKSPDD